MASIQSLVRGKFEYKKTKILDRIGFCMESTWLWHIAMYYRFVFFQVKIMQTLFCSSHFSNFYSFKMGLSNTHTLTNTVTETYGKPEKVNCSTLQSLT